MKKKMNVYWPIYKNLEKEVLNLSHHIYFNDEQLNVYSIKIAELLIRTVVEIESISKELFNENGGKSKHVNPFFDTVCLKSLEDKWKLSKKKVTVAAANFHFEEEENIILTPLMHSFEWGKKGSDWKQAYNAVKHNRGKELKEGNIKHLIRAMAALFVLNVYYREENFELGSSYSSMFDSFNNSSEMFTVKTHWYGYEENGKYIKADNFDECIYLITFTQSYLEKYKEGMKEKNAYQEFLISKQLKKISRDELTPDKFNQISREAITTVTKTLLKPSYEAVLNKDQF